MFVDVRTGPLIEEPGYLVASAHCRGKHLRFSSEQDFLAPETLNTRHLQNRVRIVCFTETVLSNSSLTCFVISSAAIYHPHKFSSNLFITL